MHTVFPRFGYRPLAPRFAYPALICALRDLCRSSTAFTSRADFPSAARIRVASTSRKYSSHVAWHISVRFMHLLQQSTLYLFVCLTHSARGCKSLPIYKARRTRLTAAFFSINIRRVIFRKILYIFKGQIPKPRCQALNKAKTFRRSRRFLWRILALDFLCWFRFRLFDVLCLLPSMATVALLR